MYIASLTGDEIASRFPVSSAEAMARASPDSVWRMRASIASRMPLTVDGVAKPPAAAFGRSKRLDRAQHEARGADALEVDVAGEIVAAGVERP